MRGLEGVVGIFLESAPSKPPREDVFNTKGVGRVVLVWGLRWINHLSERSKRVKTDPK